LRRLYKKNGGTQVGRVEEATLTALERQAIDYSVRLERGHYLFSRCWLLVEGKSDYHLMPLLFEIDRQVQEQDAFSILEISEAIGKGEPFIKLAKALGVEWFLMADGDLAGQDYVNRANNYLDTGEALADRARMLTHRDIEHEFWKNGYDGFITNMVPGPRKAQIATEAAGDADKETALLIKAAIRQAGGKPAFAHSLASEIRVRGKATIPQTIRDVMARVAQLSQG
jgi:putative ATP-dependent endonuclease of OLD family